MKTKAIISIAIVALVYSINTQAQTYINGTVKDADTKEALSYTNCYLRNKQVVAYTNDEGKFVMLIEHPSKSDSVEFSYIGYKKQTVAVSKIMKKRRFVIYLKPQIQDIKEVEVSAKSINTEKFMKSLIRNYWRNYVKEAHISKAYYYETAKRNSKHIMFAESLGYSIHLGKKFRAAKLSNYKFFYENTRKASPSTEWLKYKSNNDVSAGGSTNLNAFRRIELSRILNKKQSKYTYKLDTSYRFNGREVYRIRFESNYDSGTIDAFADNMHIKNINMQGAIWSAPLRKIVKGQINVNFIYIDNQAFVSSIKTYFKKGKLEYWNYLRILMLKSKGFSYSKSEYWTIDSNSNNPFVRYNPNKWNIKTFDNLNRKQIEKDLTVNGLSLEQQFKNNSNKNFSEIENYDNMQAESEKFVKRLKTLF